MTGTVFDISHYMLEDGPGIRTNVFFKGCPLKCKWCSNIYGIKPQIQLAFRKERCMGCGRCMEVCIHSAIQRQNENRCCVTDHKKCTACMQCVKVCISGARTQVGRQYSVQEVIREVEKDRKYYRRSGGGVTLSGGEILMQAEFAYQILSGCRARLINTAIETSAFGRWEELSRLISCCDTVFIDCKCMDPTLHKELTGVENGLILENIRKAAKLCEKEKICLIIRLPLIPTLNDTQKNLMETVEFVKSLPGEILLNVLPYHNYGEAKYEHVGEDYTLKEIQLPKKDFLKEVSDVLEKTGVSYSIGGYKISYERQL